MEDLACLEVPIQTTKGASVTDILRFFHGDGPARQFESGGNIGGDYPCTQCKAHSTRFDDISYTFRSEQVTLKERQQFVTRGKAWKTRKLAPFENLTKKELEIELKAHGKDATGLKKDLEKQFCELRGGIKNVPALLQMNPQASLSSLNISNYEVAPGESLHDIKGHLGHVIEELAETAPTADREVITSVKKTVLSKKTLRGSDYRKACLVILHNLRKLENVNTKIMKLFETLVEIQEICYAREAKRNDLTILRLYNLTFVHALLCYELFSQPKTTTRRTMFGAYFHAITCHAPKAYRYISLRSLNAQCS